MPGTVRKSTPKVQPAKVVPSAEAVPETVERYNIADVLAVGSEPPLPVTLFGADFEIRRTYSGEEAAEFFKLTGSKNYLDMLNMVTDKGAEVWGKIGGLNATQAAAALHKILELSGLFEGKLLAPLPAYTQGMAGAQHTQDSSLTTG